MMARLIRVEACAECSHCHREYVNDDMASRCWCDLLNPDGTGRDWVDAASIDPDCPLEEERAWIPVGERLPELVGQPFAEVLVAVGPTHIPTRPWWSTIGRYDGQSWMVLAGDGWSRIDEASQSLLTVTHWRSLPPLPQEASDGK